jgi:hypothetical protein
MALVRCEECGTPKGKKLSYTRSHKFVSDARIHVFCGTANCTQVARICWLTDEEEQQYVCGERRFTILFHGMVRLT